MHQLYAASLAVLILLCPALLRAASMGDIDLLTTSGGMPPNVMLVLDNSSSMDADVSGDPLDRMRFEVGHDVIASLINTINPDDGAGGVIERARFGFATFNVASGGYARRCVGATIDVPVGPATNKGLLMSALDTVRDEFVNEDETSSGTCISETLVDIGRYFAEGHVLGAYPTDLQADRFLPEPQTLDEDDLRDYEPVCWGPCPSPVDLECRKNFVVLVTDGGPNRDLNNHYGVPTGVYGDLNPWTAFMDFFGNADGDANECSLLFTDPAFDPSCVDDPMLGRDDGDDNGGDDRGDWLDDVAFRLARTDMAPSIDGMQELMTYPVGFAIDKALLQETADNGLGLYSTADTADELEAALLAALLDALAKSGSFTAPSVPARQVGSGDLLLRSFFEPKPSEPFWAGHLEAYALSPSGGIKDQNGDPATDPLTGIFDPNAVPFWDAGELLKSNTTRTLYTTKGGNRVVFESPTVTPGNLDVSAEDRTAYPNYDDPAIDLSSADDVRDALVSYVTGRDAFDEDGDADITELREIVLGDIFHSTPLVIGPVGDRLLNEAGFGTPAGSSFYEQFKNRGRVAYAGANDGMLHAFHAGQYNLGDDPNTAAVETGYYDRGTGEEVFGYVPGLLLDELKHMPLNSPRSTYYVDGEPVAADVWLDLDGDNVKDPSDWATVLITGFRQGGEGYLALDVTDPTAVAAPHGPYPKLLWEFTHSKLGETWSKPVVARIKQRGPTAIGDTCGKSNGDGDCVERWVAIFGGGYREDGNPNSPSFIGDPSDGSFSPRGKAIFMVALDTGAVLASVEFDETGVDGPAEMLYAIPSQPAVLDLNFDGFADVVYVGDLGGQMWKWDISTVGVDSDADLVLDNWTAGVTFRAYPDAATWAGGPTRYRNIFFPPTAAFHNGRLVLAFGTGERDDPMHPGLAGAADNNRFYVVGDSNPIGPSAFALVRYEDVLTDITGLDSDPDPSDDGFYFVAAEGEKFVTDHQIFAGFVITASFTPQPAVDCATTGGGVGLLYVFGLANGEGFFSDASGDPVRTLSVGGGLPSSPKLSVNVDGTAEIYLQTSEGAIIAVDGPSTGDPLPQMIYWRTKL
jgi:hypothetical protein